MKTRPYLSLADVQRIGEAASGEAVAHGWAVSVARWATTEATLSRRLGMSG